MGRLTTKTHTFTVPYDTNLIEKIRVVYAQDGDIVFKKEKQDVTLDGNVVTVKLSQEDTFKFSHKIPVEIQLRVLFKSGDAKNSDIIKTSVKRCLDDEVLL